MKNRAEDLAMFTAITLDEPVARSTTRAATT